MQEGEWEMNEYSPPQYMLKNGPLVFGSNTYAELRKETHRFPDPGSIKEITSRDVLGVLQLTAPGPVLGTLGMSAKLNSESIVAVTDGELDKEVAEFRALIEAVNNGADGMHSDAPHRVIEFQLDSATFIVWRPFGYDVNGKAVLNLAELIGREHATTT